MFGFHCICSLSDYSVAGIRLPVLARSIGCSIKENVADRWSDDRASSSDTHDGRSKKGKT